MEIELELRPSALLLLAGYAYSAALGVAAILCNVSPWSKALLLALIALIARHALGGLHHGLAGRAIRRLSWSGGANFVALTGRGCEVALRLNPVSRRIGRAMLLKFGGPGRPCIVVLPGMTDADSGRRLRVLLTLRSPLL